MYMKKLYVFVIIASFVFSCGNGASGPVKKLDSFVDDVEAESENFSVEDWEKVNEKFETLVESVTENYDSMTDEEKSEAMKAIGRYTGIYTKMGMKTAAEEFQKAMDALNPFVEGFSSVFDSDK